MHLIDGHLDLAYLALRGRDLRKPLQDSADGCVTLPALREGDVKIVFGTIFTEPTPTAPIADHPEMYCADDSDAAEAAALRQLRVYEQLEAQGDIALIRRRDLEISNGPIKVLLLMEGADPIRSPAHVPQWFDRGLRIVGLAWAAGTRYAGGNSAKPGEGPLTAQGVEMIRALDDAGIIHDASHLSDAAFDGLMQHARGPVIASHSNCRALVDDRQRHLRNDQIKAIVNRGGVIGLNLYSKFLAKNRRATVADCVAHLRHIVDLAGHCRGIGLGSDMDGGFGPADLPVGLDHPSRLHALADALHDAGWSDEDIERFQWRNWQRLLERALK